MKVITGGLIICFITGLYCSAIAQDWKLYADSAQLSKEQRMNPKALQYFINARNALPQDSSLSTTSIIFSKNIGELYYSTGKLEQCLIFSKELLKTVSTVQGENSADYAWVCNLLGVVFNLRGEMDSAMMFHQRA